MTPPNAPARWHLVQIFDPASAVWHIIDRRDGRLQRIAEWPERGVAFDYTLQFDWRRRQGQR